MTINGLMDKLFLRHSKELLLFATQRAGNGAEDLVQEAYLRLLQHPDPGSIENVRAFLFRTTSNLSIDLYRRQMLETRYRVEQTDDLENDTEVFGISAATPAPETQISQQQELELLSGMLRELPEVTRYVFMLKRIEGFPTPRSPNAWAFRNATRNATSPSPCGICLNIKVSMNSANRLPQRFNSSYFAGGTFPCIRFIQ